MIFVECYSDEFFLKCLGIPKRRIKHEGGKTKVIARIGQNGRRTGVIDEDPGDNLPVEFMVYEEIDSVGGISKFTRKSDDSKEIIVIKPKLEPWLIKKANDNNILLQRYNLPNDSKELHKINPYNRPNYRRFLSDLTNANDEEIQTLKQWLMEAIR